MPIQNRVFISYASEDLERVSEINEILKKEGVDTWFDKDQLEAGVKWQEHIQKAIENCRFFLACFSENSVNKESFVRQEFEQALLEQQLRKEEIYVFPALIEKISKPKISVGFLKYADFQYTSLIKNDAVIALADRLKKLTAQENKLFEAEESSENQPQFLNDDLAAALDGLVMSAYKNDSKHLSEIIQKSGLYHDNLKRFREKLLEPDDFYVENNRITYRLMKIIETETDLVN